VSKCTDTVARYREKSDRNYLQVLRVVEGSSVLQATGPRDVAVDRSSRGYRHTTLLPGLDVNSIV